MPKPRCDAVDSQEVFPGLGADHSFLEELGERVPVSGGLGVRHEELGVVAVIGKTRTRVSASRGHGHRIDHESRIGRPLRFGRERRSVHSSLHRNHRPGGGVHDFVVQPHQLGVDPGVAPVVGLVGVDQGHVHRQPGAGHIVLPGGAVLLLAHCARGGVQPQHVGAQAGLGGYERQIVALGLESADQKALAVLLDGHLARLHRGPEVGGQPQSLEAHQPGDHPAQASSGHQPVHRHARHDGHQLQVLLLLAH